MSKASSHEEAAAYSTKAESKRVVKPPGPGTFSPKFVHCSCFAPLTCVCCDRSYEWNKPDLHNALLFSSSLPLGSRQNVFLKHPILVSKPTLQAVSVRAQCGVVCACCTDANAAARAW